MRIVQTLPVVNPLRLLVDFIKSLLYSALDSEFWFAEKFAISRSAKPSLTLILRVAGCLVVGADIPVGSTKRLPAVLSFAVVLAATVVDLPFLFLPFSRSNRELTRSNDLNTA